MKIRIRLESDKKPIWVSAIVNVIETFYGYPTKGDLQIRVLKNRRVVWGLNLYPLGAVLLTKKPRKRLWGEILFPTNENLEKIIQSLIND
jgi:hypothetical protein